MLRLAVDSQSAERFNLQKVNNIDIVLLLVFILLFCLMMFIVCVCTIFYES